jgi:hypothetical protein
MQSSIFKLSALHRVVFTLLILYSITITFLHSVLHVNGESQVIFQILINIKYVGVWTDRDDFHPPTFVFLTHFFRWYLSLLRNTLNNAQFQGLSDYPFRWYIGIIN